MLDKKAKQFFIENGKRGRLEYINKTTKEQRSESAKRGWIKRKKLSTD